MSVVGIDLGTTNTVVGCVRNGKVHVLADEKGTRLLPSVVSFHPNGEVLVGAVAKARRIIDAKHTVYSHKRLIGRSWGSPEIAQARSRFPFELREGPGQGPLVHARGQEYTLPEISAFVLKRARQIAEVALGTPVERAVITVPAHFNELQRASTKVAGRVSGLEVLRILNEPTAAALAYGLGRSGSERVAVYDFGGGTFDCTLLDLNGNVFEVLATAGDSFLGGDDIDNLIADRMAEVFLRQFRVDVRLDAQMHERLKSSSEEVKIALSTAETHTIAIKDLGHAPGGAPINFQFTLSRKDLEIMMTPLVDRSFKVTQDALSLARLTPSSFDKVILVGGSTRAPLIRRRVEAFFGSTPMDRVNPDEVVAIGAAIQAAALTEGIRRRSIPAAPHPQRISQDDTEGTQTSEVTAGGPKPAFASEPPAFGFAPNVPAPPPVKAPAIPAAAAPPPTVPTAKPILKAPHAPPKLVARQQTNPGVAPVTQPMGARPAPKPAGPKPAPDDLLSFPDLSPPTPFEWFPSGSPSSGETKPRAAAAPSERTFGGNDPKALATTTKSNTAMSRGSVPSFPSVTAAGGHGAPAPIGVEPSPFEQPRRPPSFAATNDEPFGEIQDVSIASTSGVAPPTPNDPFGHVSDLSLIAGPAGSDRSGAAASSGEFEDETRVRRDAKGQTLLLDPAVSPARPAPPVDPLLDRADLPAVAPKPKPARTPGQGGNLGMRSDGGTGMAGKAPPLIAPQPFGPMEKMEETETSTRTAEMAPPRGAPPVKPPPPAPMTPLGKTGTAVFSAGGPGAPLASAPQTSPMQGRGGNSALGTTAPLGKSAYGAEPEPFAVAPTGRAPTPPPPAMQPHAHAGNHAFAFAPGAPPGAQGPPRGQQASGSQPPIFGTFQSSPPDASVPLDYGAGALRAEIPPAAATPLPAIQYQSPVLVDVTPRGLLVETAGGYTDTIIPRNSKIPCERTRRFATGRDMQTTVRVRVAQGESPNFPQNTYLGEVELSGLRPAARGEVTVAVTFEVDADGSVRVRAQDVQTGQEARATLKLVGVADESSVVMMINRFAQQPVVGGPTERS